uniref:Merozoite surface antigen 1 n=1 Tax=Babesia canis canis TaxID=167443 RepID=A0A0N9EJH6_BABCA|nr:merozoite surface antigen 1 [Babesia canis canis]
MMLLFALSTLVTFAFCDGENTILLSNVEFHTPVSSVKLLKEYSSNQESMAVIMMLTEMPNTSGKLTDGKVHVANDNVKCADLALAYQELKKAGKVTSWSPTDDNDKVVPHGIWFIEGVYETDKMFEVYKTLTDPEDPSEVTRLTTVSGASGSAQSQPGVTTGGVSGSAASASGSSGSTTSHSTTVTTTSTSTVSTPSSGTSTSTSTDRSSVLGTQTSYSAESSVHKSSVVASTQSTTSENAESVEKQSKAAVQEPKNVLMILTKCDLNAKVTEEQIRSQGNPESNGSSSEPTAASPKLTTAASGFTAAITPLFMVPLMFFA